MHKSRETFRPHLKKEYVYALCQQQGGGNVSESPELAAGGAFCPGPLASRPSEPFFIFPQGGPARRQPLGFPPLWLHVAHVQFRAEERHGGPGRTPVRALLVKHQPNMPQAIQVSLFLLLIAVSLDSRVLT